MTDDDQMKHIFQNFINPHKVLTEEELAKLQVYLRVIEAGQLAIIKAQAAVQAWNYHKSTHALCYDVLAIN